MRHLWREYVRAYRDMFELTCRYVPGFAWLAGIRRIFADCRSLRKDLTI